MLHDCFHRGLCMAVVFLGAVYPGGGAMAESLLDAMRAAYENNPALLAERARQRADDEALPQALSGYRPTVSLDGSVGRLKQRQARPITHNDLEQRNVAVTVSQPIFRGFRTINATRRARAEVAAGQETLLDKEQSTLLDVVLAYIDVRRARRILRLRQSNVGFLQHEVEVTKARAREGELTKTDTEQARSRLYTGRATLEEARGELAAAEATYEAVVGSRPGTLAVAPPVRHLVPRSLGEATSVSDSDNPLIAAADYRRQAAKHEVAIQRGELLPTVSLDGRYERSFDSSSSVDRQDDASLKLNFSMPFYNAGTTFSKIRQARATLVQREHEYADIQRQVKASVITAWQRRLAAHKRMRAAHVGVSSAETALKGIRMEADVGERSLFDVLDAQRDVVNARVLQVTAERDFVEATFTLIAAMGRLTAEQLELETEYYDPNENYHSVRYAPAWTASVRHN